MHPFRSPSGLSAVSFLVLLGSAAHAQALEHTSDKLHPQMIRLLDERGPAKAWVFFEDKGIRDAAHLQRALRDAEADLTPRARARREARRTLPGLVDLRDVPVNQAYVDQTVQTGVELVVRTSWLNAISVHGSREQLERVAELPFVDRIEPVRRGRIIDGSDDATVSTLQRPKKPSWYGASQTQLAQMNLIDVHRAGYRGDGVIIGILDTGFSRVHDAFNHPGHVVDVLAEFDFVNNDPNTAPEVGDDPNQHNHGTYILGTLAAHLPNVLVGAAYDASFVLCKTEDITNEYQQEEDFYVAGLQFIESNGADLSTSSLGYIDWYSQADLDGLTATTTVGVNVATSNGLICITAAGNSGHDSNASTSSLIAPADALEVITCGAVDSTGFIASFSSDGPTADGRTKPEILAQGVSTSTVSPSSTNALTAVSGTSLSTPLVAGAVACLLDAHPNWGVQQMRNRLFATGDYFRANGGTDPLFVLGYGIPDVYRAGFDDPHKLPVNVVPTPTTY